MATHDDNYYHKKKKEVRIEPLHKDTPVAATPTHEAELAKIREEIEHLQQEITTNSDTVADTPEPLAEPETSKQVLPVVEHKKTHHSSAAASLIRRKVARLYAKEPDVLDEAIESFAVGQKRSKHQQYMYDLSTSGKSLAEIQTAWHSYYVALPDNEKHEVWQEFYRANESAPHTQQHGAHHNTDTTHTRSHTGRLGTSHHETKTVAELKKRVISKVNAEGRLSAKHHLKSLLFGFGMATIVVTLLLFGFFNERFIAPFMSPSRQVTATPIVGNAINVGPEPKIIIPKINVEVPVVYDVGTTEEKAIQAALENGVVHYATSPLPGQIGNTVIVGHSSNNILNRGKYKFAFVLLNRLEIGDTFSLHRDGIRYTYQIFEKKIVKPTDVSVLGPSTRPTTATLITCDPPGTTVNRLIIVAEQISPDPANNVAGQQLTPRLTDTGVLPSNAPSLWQRIRNVF